MQKESFFSLAAMKQPVNQWICVAFLGVWCFWVVLYYFVDKTQAIGNAYYGSAAVSAFR